MESSKNNINLRKNLIKGYKLDVKLVLRVLFIGVMISLVVTVFFLQTYSLKFNNSNNIDKQVLYTSAKVSDEDLLNSIKKGRISEVERLLSLGANPNAVDNIQRNAIILAAIFNSNPKIISLLKSYKVNINHQDINGYNAIMMSILSGGNNNDFSDSLIKAGVNVNAKTNSGISVLMVAVGASNNEKVIENIIKAGANINYKNSEGVTALMVAAKITTNPKVIETLLKHGANKNDTDSLGISVYEIAKSNKYLRSNEKLLNKLK